jgi:hypothetical protein
MHRAGGVSTWRPGGCERVTGGHWWVRADAEVEVEVEVVCGVVVVVVEVDQGVGRET